MQRFARLPQGRPQGKQKRPGYVKMTIFFAIVVRITGKLLKIDGYMLRGVWQALNYLFIHATFCAIAAKASPGQTKKMKAWESVVDTNEQLRRGKTTYAHSLSPLYFRCKKLSLQYCLKLSCNYNNPAYATVFNSKFQSVFERNPTQLPPLAVRVSGDLQAVGFKKSDVITSFISNTPPWL